MSGPEIDPNKLREDGLTYAADQLMEAAQVLAAELDLREAPEEIIRKYPTLVVAIAKLAHLDERAEESRLLKEAELEELHRIADGVELAVDCMMQLIVGELKERWITIHPNHTEAALKAAMGYFDSMAVRGSGLKYDDK